MKRPFILPSRSMWRQVPKKGILYSSTIYIADPVNMLTHAQILQYTDMAGKHLKIDLPLCPPSNDTDDNEPFASSNQPHRLFNDFVIGESSEVCGRQQPVSPYLAQWSTMRPPMPTSIESLGTPSVQLGSTLAVQRRLCTTFTGSSLETYALHNNDNNFQDVPG